MGKTWMAAALAAGMLTSGAAMAASPAEDEIGAIEAKWSQAFVTKDVATVDRIVASDWRGQDDRGAGDKAKMIERLKSGKDTTTSSKLHDVHVRVMGDVAVAQGMEDDKGMRGGKPYAETVGWTDVFQKRNGHWLAVASQNATLKAK